MDKRIVIVLIIILLAIVGFVIMTNKTLPQETPITPSPSPTLQLNQETIEIKNFAFNPAELIVKKGTTVTWTNQDSTPHKIKSDTFNSEDLSQGASFSFTFENTGSFGYICGIHPSMKGTIEVK